MTEKEREKFVKAQNGNLACFHNLAEKHQKLVSSVAWRYCHNQHLPYEDLIGEGQLALLRAVLNFDTEREIEFSTYACSCIESAIKRAIAKARAHGIYSIRVSQLAGRVICEEDRLAHTLGRAAKHQELADWLGVSQEKLEEIKHCAQGPLPMGLPSHSYENDGSSDYPTYPVEWIADDPTSDPLNVLIANSEPSLTAELVGKGLAWLAQNRRSAYAVAVLRFGLMGEEKHTLEEVGARLNCTRQRVWQLEQETLKLLNDFITKNSAPDWLEML